MVKENFNKFVTARNTINAIKENVRSTKSIEQFEEIQQAIQQILQFSKEISNPLADSKAKQIQIQRNIELVHEFEPFLNANTRIKHLHAIQNYEELAQCYLACKSLYSSIKKTKIVNNLWSSIERTIDTIRISMLKDLKNENLSTNITKIPTILMYVIVDFTCLGR